MRCAAPLTADTAVALTVGPGVSVYGGTGQSGVAVSRGNRIDYTLDNAGLRIAEQVKDPTGALKRQLTRIPDALGRVQQTIGRE